MKKLFALLLLASAVLYQSCSPTTLATVGNNAWKVTLYHYQGSGVKLQENGRDCVFVQAYAAHKKAGYIASQNGSNGTWLMTTGIQLDRSTEKHTITLIKGDKTVEVAIEKQSKPFIDVTAALGETKVMSMADLQSEYLKNHKKD
jgi:hypothetical protein